jgi:hypothetical protein
MRASGAKANLYSESFVARINSLLKKSGTLKGNAENVPRGLCLKQSFCPKSPVPAQELPFGG